MKTSVIGGGTWGTALAIVLAVNGHEVTIWSALERERKALTEAPDQIRNLPGARLPDSAPLHCLHRPSAPPTARQARQSSRLRA